MIVNVASKSDYSQNQRNQSSFDVRSPPQSWEGGATKSEKCFLFADETVQSGDEENEINSGSDKEISHYGLCQIEGPAC